MTEIVALGTGGPTPTPARFGSAFAVRVGERHLLFDCGPATTLRLVQAGIAPTDVDHLFFTHHHFDHDVDYPCFLLTRWDQGIGVEPELDVRRPAPTALLTARLLDPDIGAFSHDWKARIAFPSHLRTHVERGGSLPRRPPSVRATDIEPGFAMETESWRLTAAVADHVQPYLDSLAYRLDTAEGSIVFTGDTQPCGSVTELARDVDVLVAMCTGIERDSDAPDRYAGTSGTTGAARMARDAGAGRLVLTHLGPQLETPSDRDRALEDVARTFDGPVEFAEELGRLSL